MNDSKLSISGNLFAIAANLWNSNMMARHGNEKSDIQNAAEVLFEKILPALEQFKQQAVAAEREKIARLVEEFDDWLWHSGDEVAEEAGQVSVPKTSDSMKALANKIREDKK